MTLTRKKSLVHTLANGSPIEQVYFILDSYIQRAEFEALSCYKNSCNKSTITISGKLHSTSDQMMQNFDQMLQHLEVLEKKRKLLQILRSWLKENNALLILDLLTNNRYLDFSEEVLESLVKSKSNTQLAVTA